MALVLLLCLAVAQDSKEPQPMIRVAVWSATWCGPCRAMEPDIERLQREGWRIQRYDVDQQPEQARKWGVTTIPAVIVFEKAPQWRILARVGKSTYSQLLQLFRQHRVGKTNPPGPAAG